MMNNREILRRSIIVLGLAIAVLIWTVGVDGLFFLLDKKVDNKLINQALANIGIAVCLIIGLFISFFYPIIFKNHNTIAAFFVCVAYSPLGLDYYALGNAPEMRGSMISGMVFSIILGSVVSLGIASSWMKYFQDN